MIKGYLQWDCPQIPIGYQGIKPNFSIYPNVKQHSDFSSYIFFLFMHSCSFILLPLSIHLPSFCFLFALGEFRFIMISIQTWDVNTILQETTARHRFHFFFSNLAKPVQPQNKEYLQNDQHTIRDSSVIFVAPYWQYRISCLKVQLAPLARGAGSQK